MFIAVVVDFGASVWRVGREIACRRDGMSADQRLPTPRARVFVRCQSPECLPREITYHVLPLAARYCLVPDAVLLDYMLMCARLYCAVPSNVTVSWFPNLAVLLPQGSQ